MNPAPAARSSPFRCPLLNAHPTAVNNTQRLAVPSPNDPDTVSSRASRMHIAPQDSIPSLLAGISPVLWRPHIVAVSIRQVCWSVRLLFGSIIRAPLVPVIHLLLGTSLRHDERPRAIENLETVWFLSSVPGPIRVWNHPQNASWCDVLVSDWLISLEKDLLHSHDQLTVLMIAGFCIVAGVPSVRVPLFNGHKTNNSQRILHPQTSHHLDARQTLYR